MKFTAILFALAIIASVYSYPFPDAPKYDDVQKCWDQNCRDLYVKCAKDTGCGNAWKNMIECGFREGTSFVNPTVAWSESSWEKCNNEEKLVTSDAMWMKLEQCHCSHCDTNGRHCGLNFINRFLSQ